jgi:hypothetical protein
MPSSSFLISTIVSMAMASGEPPNAWLFARMSDLPPKPPMRSTPLTNPAANWVLTRSSSFAVGPSARNLVSSSSMTFSTFESSTPGLALLRSSIDPTTGHE